jgi:hypothetical protein
MGWPAVTAGGESRHLFSRNPGSLPPALDRHQEMRRHRCFPFVEADGPKDRLENHPHHPL